MLVPAEVRHEHSILAQPISVADGFDHTQVLAKERQRVEEDPNAAWTAVGAARFCEDYLDVSLTNTPDHLYLLDAGLSFMRRQGLLNGNVSLECLSRAERVRLAPSS